MSAIYTITFSPCIDKSTSVPALVAEKKLRCSAPVLEPGGGGINVARGISRLGGKVTAVFPAGGYTGKAFNDLLKRENIPFIAVESEQETRENIVVLDASTNHQYRFGMPGTPLSETEWKQIIEKLEQAGQIEYIVASGSLPPGVPDDIFGTIAVIAKKKNARLIVDTSGEALKNAVAEGVFLLKPNLGELSALTGKDPLNHEDICPAAQSIIRQGMCEVVVVSMGAAGAMLVTKSISKTITPVPVKTKSTVGAGDSMVAGIVWSLSNGGSLEEAVRYGVACGTAATMNPGTELFRVADVKKIYSLLQNPAL